MRSDTSMRSESSLSSVSLSSGAAAPAGTVPLRERNRARTRQDIERAALDLMESQGYQATTVDEIARRAGVSSATVFRYFPAKEDILFAQEHNSADRMVAMVAERRDRSQTLRALSAPVTAFAEEIFSETGSQAHRLTRLVMTTPELAGRSMRMRLRWEHGIGRQLARETGTPDPDFDQVLVANLAVSCLAAALWQWQRGDSPASIASDTRRAFRGAAALARPADTPRTTAPRKDADNGAD
jgi:AcrR family transcriptional regulator